MKILAVSDIQSKSLESLLERSPGKLKNLDVILSCGDLDREYLEFLADGTNRELLFVHGNHVSGREGTARREDEGLIEKVVGTLWAVPGRIIEYIAGQADLHGRVEVFGNYLIA